jgi:hypothetical protein
MPIQYDEIFLNETPEYNFRYVYEFQTTPSTGYLYDLYVPEALLIDQLPLKPIPGTLPFEGQVTISPVESHSTYYEIVTRSGDFTEVQVADETYWVPNLYLTTQKSSGENILCELPPEDDNMTLFATVKFLGQYYICTGYTSKYGGYYVLNSENDTMQVFDNQKAYMQVVDEPGYYQQHVGHIALSGGYGLIIETKLLSYGPFPPAQFYTFACVLYDDYTYDQEGERKAHFVPIHQIKMKQLEGNFSKEEIELEPILAFARDLNPTGAIEDIHQTLVPTQSAENQQTRFTPDYMYPTPSPGRMMETRIVYNSTEQQIQYAGLTIGIIMLFMIID